MNVKLHRWEKKAKIPQKEKQSLVFKRLKVQQAQF